MTVVNHAGLHRFFVNEKEEGVADQFHLVERFINAHRDSLMNLLPHDDRGVSQLLLTSFTNLEVSSALERCRGNLFHFLD